MPIMMQSKSCSSSRRMAAVRQLVQFASLVALALMLVVGQLPAPAAGQEQLSIESRQQKDSDDLTDTIKYLEKLDKYFSQIARPRFGRSDYKQPHRLQPGWSLAGARSIASSSQFGDGPSAFANQNGGFDGADLLELARSRFN